MRAITRSRLAPLFIAAAILATGLSADMAASATAHHQAATVAAPSSCPAGTNWDDKLQECVPG